MIKRFVARRVETPVKNEEDDSERYATNPSRRRVLEGANTFLDILYS